MRKKEPKSPDEQFDRDFDSIVARARNKIVEDSQKARKIEEILSREKTRGNKTLLYALRAVLIELSNESGVGVDARFVAGNFYQAAASEAENADNHTVRACFRHLDVLLSNPDAKTARKIADYWDSPGTMDMRLDPFPESEEDHQFLDPKTVKNPRKRQNKVKVSEVANEEDSTSAIRGKLAKLERLPENEAERFRLETEIYQLERAPNSDEWPEVIGGAE